jgi:hypothetical protein
VITISCLACVGGRDHRDEIDCAQRLLCCSREFEN